MVLAAGWLWCAAVPGWTAEPMAPAQSRDQVDEMMGKYNLYPAFEKGGRGLANFFGGWLEIPLNIGKYYSTSDTAGSMVTGVGHGLVKGLVRTGVGFYEAITFFLPYPENYAPILPTLPYFQKSGRREPLPLE
jgi:putative exosortase-associated protein (TIGR04073 family)